METAAEWKEGDADVDADAGFQCCVRQAEYSAARLYR